MDDWLNYESSCYKMFEVNNIRWWMAESNCNEQAQGSHLVSIAEAYEASFVLDVARLFPTMTQYRSVDFVHLGKVYFQITVILMRVK